MLCTAFYEVPNEEWKELTFGMLLLYAQSTEYPGEFSNPKNSRYLSYFDGNICRNRFLVIY